MPRRHRIKHTDEEYRELAARARAALAEVDAIPHAQQVQTLCRLIACQSVYMTLGATAQAAECGTLASVWLAIAPTDVVTAFCAVMGVPVPEALSKPLAAP